ncbi:DNA polymerase III subunit delta' [Marinospirillum sp.]|uniref:DNA polymerase III subunit delta' n=1 Tax=Marinospirillum sp. TaxID=2183934 RepID=UPI00286FC6DB|nr:DNA polymerase III subunit delta' [Marinospirillum sp.]MDR9467839.1 DNA polymerase III subunit delta' [Marinospirillum sp.]
MSLKDAGTSPSAEQKPALPLPWQAEIWRQWLQQMQDGRLPHAILLSGLPGLGKRTLARALAHYLLCEQPQATEPCGRCSSCQLLDSGFHPDWHSLEPEAPGKAIKVDQVRDINTQVQQSAQRGGYKLVLIWPAEAMNLNAANALLKTLEEPEPRTQFVLVSDQPSALPATLRSRCQQWPIKPPDQATGQAWLSCQLTQEQNPEILLKAAGGRPLQAVKLATPELEEPRQLLLQTLEAMTRGADPSEQAARLKNFPLQDLLDYLQSWLADTLRLKLVGEAGVADSRQLPLYRNWQQLLSSQQLLNLDAEFKQAHHQLLTNPNNELFIEKLLIRLTEELGHE